jgi:hypothetical protein
MCDGFSSPVERQSPTLKDYPVSTCLINEKQLVVRHELRRDNWNQASHVFPKFGKLALVAE